MSITIVPVTRRCELRSFIHLPWRIYTGDPNWVPPLLAKMKRLLDSRSNGYLRRGPHRLFLAYKAGGPAGRLRAGVDEATPRAKGTRDGWFSLFESVPDYEVAEGLLDAAREYLAGLGCDRMRGPVSPSGGDDYRGLLIWGFDSPPVLMDSYNPPYYQEFLDRYGLEKFIDWFAYRLPYRMPKNPRAVAYAQERYGFRLDRLDLSRLDREVADMHRILSRAMPEWPDQEGLLDRPEAGRKEPGVAEDQSQRIAEYYGAEPFQDGYAAREGQDRRGEREEDDDPDYSGQDGDLPEVM